MNCPRCTNDKIVKNGYRQGKQCYLGKDCHRQCRQNPSPQGHSADVKNLCVKMSLKGRGLWGSERVTSINHTSGIHGVSQAEAAIPEENHEIPETAQLDALQTVVGARKTKFGSGPW